MTRAPDCSGRVSFARGSIEAWNSLHVGNNALTSRPRLLRALGSFPLLVPPLLPSRCRDNNNEGLFTTASDFAEPYADDACDDTNAADDPFVKHEQVRGTIRVSKLVLVCVQ